MSRTQVEKDGFERFSFLERVAINIVIICCKYLNESLWKKHMTSQFQIFAVSAEDLRASLELVDKDE